MHSFLLAGEFTRCHSVPLNKAWQKQGAQYGAGRFPFVFHPLRHLHTLVMDRLPLEILGYICQLSGAGDSHTAYQLCLANRTLNKLTSPFLFEHVYLDNTGQVAQFNEKLKSAPELGRYIRSITLNYERPRYRRDYIPESNNPATISLWNTLITTLGDLTRNHKLKTIVLTYDACRRFQYNEEKNPLAKLWAKCDLDLDHLVVCHMPLRFYLMNVKPRKITWYGCAYKVAHGFPLATSLQLKPSDRLKELTLMFGDNHNSPCFSNEWYGTYRDSSGQLAFTWKRALRDQVKGFRKVQLDLKNINVRLHYRTDRVLSTELRNTCTDYDISIGLWGTEEDWTGRPTFDKSLKRREWNEEKLYWSMVVKPIPVLVGHEEEDVEPWCDCLLGEEEEIIAGTY